MPQPDGLTSLTRSRTRSSGTPTSSATSLRHALDQLGVLRDRAAFEHVERDERRLHA